ncbi:aspartate carbamoyltransferase [Pseudenhygromyxa sp. WMMC2535]|uniref:aspartate/ornithine carbamoyltransferase family protein n=1 Tax=Pseudenhygromyxa sp. WMMC2535 TaxID=2712867 RepID=UPI001557ADFA|nr:aspartate carbamoyltransferase [Pseudenhygromyxa sp. WMMC2535]NVB41040.1 aspartate carbamoyltransferase [Pseudenhygromyxa sp. WMMC2535]
MVKLPRPARALNSKGRVLDPRALLAAGANKIDFERLEALAGRSLLEVGDLDLATIHELCKFAALLELTEIARHRPLAGKLIITAFFEASTRTRLSFESAAARLDARVLSVPDGKVTGVAKGESLADIGEMFNSYGDLVVMRHPRVSALDEIRTNLTRPLLNAGNGTGEHPTQALLDWYCLFKWRPELMDLGLAADRRLHLGIIGTPASMRAVRSFLLLALAQPHAVAKISLLSESARPLDDSLVAAVAASEVELEISSSGLDEVLPSLDAIYMNSIALLGGSYEELDQRFSLRGDSPFAAKAVVLHPLARKAELDVSLDDTEHNLYFAQAAGAVFLRQAVLISLLGAIDRVPAGVHYLAS